MLDFEKDKIYETSDGRFRVEKSDGSLIFIPADNSNAEYRAIAKWKGAGNTPLVAPEISEPPAAPSVEETLDAILEGGQKLEDVKARRIAARELNQGPKPGKKK